MTEKPGRLQSIGSQKSQTQMSTHTKDVLEILNIAT